MQTLFISITMYRGVTPSVPNLNLREHFVVMERRFYLDLSRQQAVHGYCITPNVITT